MLQTVATVLQLEKLGYDYEIIDYSRKLTLDLFFRSFSRIPEEISIRIKRYVQSRKQKKYPGIEKEIMYRNRIFEEFSNRCFVKKSEKCDTILQLRRISESYSVIMVGSDQLWVPRGYSTGFFNLLFVPDYVPRITYATRFGVSVIPKSKKKIAKKFLNRIDYIGVRELQAAKMILELTGRKVQTVVDPTLLFSGEEWRKIIPEKWNMELEGVRYIFCYFLGNNPEQRREVEKLSRETGYRIVFLPHLDEFVRDDITFGDKQIFEIGPEGFVNLIRNAECICTDSFHGTVFSILNHKRFITFERYKKEDRNSRNSRIDSLLFQTGLEDRRFQGEILRQMDRPIDYTEVEKKLLKMREDSLTYLTNALDSSVKKYK